MLGAYLGETAGQDPLPSIEIVSSADTGSVFSVEANVRIDLVADQGDPMIGAKSFEQLSTFF